MNWTGITYFLTLAEEKSFTKAAQKLHITQQALSAHIAAMEREQGCALVVRRVPLALTGSGRLFYQYARDVERRTKELARALSDEKEEPAGTLYVGSAAARGRILLPRLAADFHQRWGKIRFHFREASNRQLLDALLQGDIDIAIGAFPPVVPGAVMRDFYREHMALVMARSLGEALYGETVGAVLAAAERGDFEALHACPFLMNSSDTIAGGMGRRLLGSAGFAPDIQVESEHMETLAACGLEGLGAFFCPENLVRSLCGEDQLRRLYLAPVAGTEYTIRLARKQSQPQWSMVQRFIDFAAPLEAEAAP